MREDIIQKKKKKVKSTGFQINQCISHKQKYENNQINVSKFEPEML